MTLMRTYILQVYAIVMCHAITSFLVDGLDHFVCFHITSGNNHPH